jgi:hypothetical protein
MVATAKDNDESPGQYMRLWGALAQLRSGPPSPAQRYKTSAATRWHMSCGLFAPASRWAGGFGPFSRAGLLVLGISAWHGMAELFRPLGYR